MPGFSGTQLTEKLRKFDLTTPVLFFSGAAYETDRKADISNRPKEKRADARPLRKLEMLLPYAVFAAANFWKVDVTTSAAPTIGVPSTRFERVFSTSGYPEAL